MTKHEQDNLDRALRPTTLSEYIGQEELKQRLGIAIESSVIRNEPIGHILLCGGPGLGKTSFSSLVAKERKVEFIPIMAQSIETVADVISICRAIPSFACLFIDEIHALRTKVQESLYCAMEDFVIPIKGADAMAAGVKVKTKPFTLIGATTMMGDLETPFRNRFDIIHTMEDYSISELKILIASNAKKMSLTIGERECENIAMRSRGTPRLANRLLKRVRDFAQAKKMDVNQECVESAMAIEGIDRTGLTHLDYDYLNVILAFGGKPIGIAGIAASMNEDKSTISNDIEPYMIKRGMIRLTKQGRELTTEAYKILGITEE